MTVTTTGIDVSFWQDDNATPQRIDWPKAKAAGARFAFIRAGQASWLDQDFTYNWQQSHAAGIPRGAYWYLDHRYDPQAQAALFWKTVTVAGDHGDLPMVVDFEHRTPGLTRADAIRRLTTFVEALHLLDPRPPIIYTGPAYWTEFGSTDPTWKTHPLWIAHYSTVSPTVPAPWFTWTFWQYSNHGDGHAFGMESLGLDMDRYNNGLGFDVPILTPAAPPPQLTDAEKLNRLWLAHSELH